MFKYLQYFALGGLIGLSSCAIKQNSDPSQIISMQIIDRNGFTETISSKDRLSTYQKQDFLAPQPYQKALRVFGRDRDGKNRSKVTSYHANGQVWQYLEVLDGRAHGGYCEWHQNGRLKIEAHVIEGVADISDVAQASWLFHGKNTVYEEDGTVAAEILYEKGVLEGDSIYYYPNGQIRKIVPYDKNKIDGTIKIFDPNQKLIEKIEYKNGIKEGIAFGFWKEGVLQYEEQYERDLLVKGIYYGQNGDLVSEVKDRKGFQANFQDENLYSLIEYQNGTIDGIVKIFDEAGTMRCSYYVKNGKKNGEEWEYFPRTSQPKLCLFWQDDIIQGIVKTWYEDGMMESQKEMNGNKRHGISFAWYKDGQLMFMEEYEDDVLLKGTYFKKGDKAPVTKIDLGKGTASLFDSNGHFLKKIQYDRGKPIVE